MLPGSVNNRNNVVTKNSLGNKSKLNLYLNNENENGNRNVVTVTNESLNLSNEEKQMLLNNELKNSMAFTNMSNNEYANSLSKTERANVNKQARANMKAMEQELLNVKTGCVGSSCAVQGGRRQIGCSKRKSRKSRKTGGGCGCNKLRGGRSKSSKKTRR